LYLICDMKIGYKTPFGTCYNGSIEDFLQSKKATEFRGKINLIFTSPPFPLNRKKKYGNLQGKEYIEWLTRICNSLSECLAENGSLVIEVGNSWDAGNPTMSTLSLEALISIKQNAGLHLCQQFIWYNIAKLPSPIQWVNIERIRVKDSFTHIWWFSKSAKPKANNANILTEYSESMKRLLRRGKYNSGKRPSEHDIGKTSFLTENKGAIPSNVLVSSNTESSHSYFSYCKEKSIELHPARMPKEIPTFFIKFLTDKDDMVLDPFSGSNTTGEAAETLKRKWICIEINEEYIKGSKGRFLKPA
jgi:DNA modification methylase